MRHWKITDLAENTSHFANTENDQTPADTGYDDARFDWEEVPDEPDEMASLSSALSEDTIAAEKWAREEIERKAEEASSALVPNLHRQVMIFAMWAEVQRLKLAFAVGQVPTDQEEQRHQFPMIMALSFLSGAQPLDVAAAIETRYWDRVREMALYDAKLILAHDAVQEAPTPEAMIEAAVNLVMEE